MVPLWTIATSSWRNCEKERAMQGFGPLTHQLNQITLKILFLCYFFSYLS